MRIAVYASSSKHTPQKYLDAAAELGAAVAGRGHTLVNGGGKVGGMGAMNDACRAAGGHIVCVIHETFVVDGVDFNGADDTIVATGDSLGDRKRLLAANSDVIVALPGGVGTFDELFEAAALSQLNFEISRPVALVNVDGYYDGALKQLQRAYDEKLLKKLPADIIYPATTVKGVLDFCEAVVNELPGERRAATGPTRRSSSLYAVFFAGFVLGLALKTLRG